MSDIDPDVRPPEPRSSKRVAKFMNKSQVAEYLGLAGPYSLSRVKLPPHDAMIGGYKGWLKSTIDTWNESRPGRGWWGPRER